MTLDDVRETLEVGASVYPERIENKQATVPDEIVDVLNTTHDRYQDTFRELEAKGVDGHALVEMIEATFQYVLAAVENYIRCEGVELPKCAVDDCRYSAIGGDVCYWHWSERLKGLRKEEWTMDEMTFLSLPKACIVSREVLDDGRLKAVVDTREVEKWLNEVE